MSRIRPSRLAPLLVLALALVPVACTAGDEDAPPEEAMSGPDTAAEHADETAAPPRDCRQDALDDEDALARLSGSHPLELSTEVARRTHDCILQAVVAASEPWPAALAVPVALAADAPLLLSDGADDQDATAVLAEFEVDDVVTVGRPLDGLAEDGTELHPAGAAAAAGGTASAGADEEGSAEPTDGAARHADPDDGTGDNAGVEAGGAADAEAAGDTDEGEDGDESSDADDPDGDPDEDEGGHGSSDDADDVMALAVAVLDHLDADRALAVAHDDEESRAVALARVTDDTALLPVPEAPEALEALAADLPGALRVEVVAGTDEQAQDLADRLVDVGVDAEAGDGPSFPTDQRDTAWLADPGQAGGYAAAAVAALARDEALLPISAEDLRAGRERTERLRAVAPRRSVVVGDVTDDVVWQLPTVLEGSPLPTGGFTLFESERMVALYGTPGSSALGVLGEQDLDATVTRAREVAEPYDADGREVVPAFEMIVTVASAEAGPRDDYSRRLDVDTFRPWVDRAADEGFYVVLDLQPGRSDFLEQAQHYEELLREPHVGLALDPEWRLEPDEVHLRQIGSVEADEVQRVVDWLAELTREQGLPQKLLLLHQFRFSMLPDRDEIEIPPELAGVVHMDGQGPLGVKYDTYDAITAGAEDRWWWGWKNFYDEDVPTATPEQVLDLEPRPVFVSYQ